MELLAVVGIENVKKLNSEIVVYSDSKYVVNAIEKVGYLIGKKRTFKKKNPDLWIRFLSVYKKHSIRFLWVRSQQQC